MKTPRRISVRPNFRQVICLCCGLFFGEAVQALETDSLTLEQPADRKITHVVGLDFKPAYIFPTHPFFKGENAAFAPFTTNLSAHVKYGFKFSPDSYLGRVYPYAVQGIGIGYNSFGSVQEIGNPLAVYAFQTSRIARLSPRLSLDYEWNFGASFGWKKYNENLNPWNTVVGSKINAYIHLGFLLNWQVTDATGLQLGMGVTHYSNGNTNYPNAGVNTLGASIGFTRYFGGEEKETSRGALADTYHSERFRPRMTYDLIVYGATRKKGVFPEGSSPVLVPGHFGIVGMNFTPMYNFSPYFRAGLSLDAQYDESANIGMHIANTGGAPSADNIKFHKPPFSEQFAVGLSARAEIVMPIFSINLGIGRNVVAKGGDTNSFYQIFALKTDLTRHLFLHVGYQLYKFKDPNNLMLGLGFRFHAPKRR